MAGPWPWEVALREPAPRVEADYPALIRQGFWTDAAGIDRMAAMVAVGVPSDDDVVVRFQVVDSETCEISIDRADCKLLKRVCRINGGLEVRFDAYWIPKTAQNAGLAKRLFRNLAHGYRELGVSFVTTYANCEIGGYTWAKMGARPIDWDAIRTELMARTKKFTREGRFGMLPPLGLERTIEGGTPERVMYELATASHDGQPAGRNLLLGFAWEAFWDLTDPDHRALISEAMR